MQHDPRRDPTFLAAYGDAVVALRSARHLDRRNLAESAGISYSYLSAIESGQKLPSPRIETAITGALGVTPAELLERANGASKHRDGVEEALMGESNRSRDGDSVRARPKHSDDQPRGLSPSGALAELRVLVPTMAPQDAATIVGIARDLASKILKPEDLTIEGASPDSEVRELRTSTYLEFWSEYVTKVTNRGLGWVEGRTPEPRSYFTTTSQIKGASLSASFARNRLLRHELYINRGSRDANLDLLHHLASVREVIEAAYGRPLEFEDPGRERRAVRVAEYRDGYIKRTDEHGDYIEWFIDAGLRMRRAIAAFLEHSVSE